ncbi:hypothetical protein [Paenibacillus monticola]|uniref:CRISPR-associated protein n=1 Tax=Paenibacillus monticola TaxID=2666075 RepID=A0A7X2L1F4_9BACL|nr:hypothetical protein [Paenibacillus monticola]MRN53123.1 hypothetical protein [Paenibacillus monticola]
MISDNSYVIEICLRSEAIFGSGEKERNLVQSKALTDAEGFVYFHAKSLKGQLKRQAIWLQQQYDSFDREQGVAFQGSIAALFGLNSWELDESIAEPYKKVLREHGIMKFSHLELPASVREYFRAMLAEDRANGYIQLSQHDLIEAQTHIRTGIQCGKDKMLTTFHTVKKGLIFYSTLTFDEDPAVHLPALTRIVYSLNRIGANIHRGRGEVSARLLVNGVETKGNIGLEGGGVSRAILSGY